MSLISKVDVFVWVVEIEFLCHLVCSAWKDNNSALLWLASSSKDDEYDFDPTKVPMSFAMRVILVAELFGTNDSIILFFSSSI